MRAKENGESTMTDPTILNRHQPNHCGEGLKLRLLIGDFIL